MTRQEFLQSLAEKLSEELSPAEVQSELQYYRGYIDGEKHRGKEEEEILADLGDPALIAKTILESPRETTIFGTPVVSDAQDAYEEGAYQGANAPSQEEVKERAEAESPAGELKRQMEEAKEAAEERAAAAAKQAENAKEAAEERTAAAAGQAEKEKEEAQEAAEDRAAGPGTTGNRQPAGGTAGGEAQRQPGIFHDENGNFNWGLLAVILAVIMVITAIVWLITKFVSAVGGSTLLVILAIIFIIYTIYHSNRGGKQDGSV